MVSISVRSVICAVALAGCVGANHIKRHPGHHFTSRSQCRPRLHSTDLDEPTPTASIIHTASSAHLTTTSSTRVKSTSISTSKFTHTTAVAVVQTLSTLADAGASSSSTTSSAARSSSAAHVGAQPAATQSTQQALNAVYIPNRIKAGIAGGDAYPFMENHIGWWYDWSADPSKSGSPIAVPMLWGDGTVDAQDASRLKAFEKLSSDPDATPRYVLGYEEPDCPSGEGSADVSVADGVAKWEALMPPLRERGVKLGSPAMCKQADETWLAQFADAITTPWDFTAVHINKNSLDGVKDIEHYKKYGKPIWVTEFACVDDAGKFEPCTDQTEINSFINDAVDYFESTNDVYAYGYSNGLGLGDVWPLMNGNSLSESGKTYLAAIKQYH